MSVLTPKPHSVRRHASCGFTKEMIAAEYDLYEAEFEKLLKKDKQLQRAYDLGVVDANKVVHKQLWDRQDNVGIMLLRARMRLKLDDPVLEELSGNVLKVVLSKVNKDTRKSLASILGVR
jgi:hypothetical protein